MENHKYFIAAHGNDTNNGLSEQTPWLTIDRINLITLKPGNEILFNCGDVFEGELIIKQSGTPEQPIVIGVYGSGSKPVLKGSVKVSAKIDSNVNNYVAEINRPVYQLFANKTQYNLARIPASGFYTIETGDKNTLSDSVNLNLNYNYNLKDATVRIRAVNWQYETALVAKHSGNTITFEQSMMYQCNPRYGYILDNKLEFLQHKGQWFWDKNTQLLHFKPFDSADLANVEAVVCKNGITLAEKTSHIKISGLQLENYENAAIWGSFGSSNIAINDCTIHNVNVYGIGLDINTSHYAITQNNITDIRGRGISTLESCYNEICNNTVLRIGLNAGYGFDGVNNGIGIAILKTEVDYSISNETFTKLQDTNLPENLLKQIATLVGLPYPDEKFVIEALELALGKHDAEICIPLIMPLVNAEAKAQKLESTNNRVAYNVVDESGYAGIRVDGNNSIAECNVIKNSLLHMNDGGALYCWAQNENYTFNNIFRNNIIINAVGSCEATANDLAYAYGIYTDNKCHHITIENNTVVGTVGGILINDEAHHQKIIGNTLYDNRFGLVFSEYFMPGTLIGCEAVDNILFCKKRDQRALFNESRIREGFVPSVLNRNLYANPYYPFPIVELTFKNNIRSFKEYTLESWQKHYNNDAQSSTIATANHDAGGQQSHILINETNKKQVVEIPTDLKYTDIKGLILGSNVELEPYCSLIIIQK